MKEPISCRPEDVSTEWALRPAGRPLFLFAHQDDETVIAGAIARILAGGTAEGTFVWWTNGDGLAPAAGEDPEVYAKIRVREADAAVQVLGGRTEMKTDLWTSEIENYRRFTHVAQGGAVAEAALEYFRAEALRIEEAVRAADPDRVFLLAWQGGHPEHDLAHVMTYRAVARLRKETGAPIPILQCPAYEYVIACALRFKPWFRGDKRSVVLSEAERKVKRSVFEAYPSQRSLFDKFERVVRLFSMLGRSSPEDYLGTEWFGVVPPELDYGRSTHRLEQLNYMMDDFEGIPIRFDTMIRPIVLDVLHFG